MPVYEIDPLRDARWGDLLQRDARASIFHSSGWLLALRRTYGYIPTVLTTSPPGHVLENGLVFCRVQSWLTGTRMVSLPFSDHCEPLLDNSEASFEINSWLGSELKRKKLKYIEIRPLKLSLGNLQGVSPDSQFWSHVLDISRDEENILHSFHKDSIRRKIQRATREKLAYERGTSPQLLQNFYHLFVMTRRRHGLPPSPFKWFHNMLDSVGEKACIRIAFKGKTPVAGMITLTYKESVMYKYGASDARFNNCGGMPFLFWNVIRESKLDGVRELDLGRTDIDNEGLLTFKDRLGATRCSLTYWRASRVPSHRVMSQPRLHFAKKILSYVPDALRIEAGNVLYRHLG